MSDAARNRRFTLFSLLADEPVSRALNDNANVLLLRIKRGLRVAGAVRQRGKLNGWRDDVAWLLQYEATLMPSSHCFVIQITVRRSPGLR